MRLKKYSYKKVESTNKVALRLIKQGNEKGIVFAELQTKGRGLGKNKWISMKGNLFLSIFFEISKKISLAKLIDLNIKLIKKVIRQKINTLIQIKKPNDILLNKKKVCGILQEILHRNNRKYLIIGVGINIVNSPKINSYPTTFLNLHSGKKINKYKYFQDIKILYEKNLHNFRT